MTRFFVLCAILSNLSACVSGTNPFSTDDEETTTTVTTDETSDAATTDDTTTAEVTTDSGDPISSDRTLLPGTVNPSANDSIFRREATSTDSGDGYAESVSYDGATDTFTVDNIAFDGEDPYTVVLDGGGDRFGIGPFSVFESPATAVDGLTSGEITQLSYRALYGVSDDGNSSIAIIRTGAYIEYGFGGYIFQREGGVTLPTSGQALYTGEDNYGGLRDFNGSGGLEYVNGDMEVRIDFDDFNEGAAVIGVVSNRRVFDMDGIDVTNDILDAFGAGTTELPVVNFVIESGVIDSNGEIAGTIQSTNPADSSVFESGNYYAILSGDDATTITGIVVLTASDPRDSGVTVRETAGFFAVRE